jgi:hypothetical protein
VFDAVTERGKNDGGVGCGEEAVSGGAENGDFLRGVAAGAPLSSFAAWSRLASGLFPGRRRTSPLRPAPRRSLPNRSLNRD